MLLEQCWPQYKEFRDAENDLEGSLSCLPTPFSTSVKFTVPGHQGHTLQLS